VYNSEGREIINSTATDTQLVMASHTLPKENPSSFFWSVQSVSKPCRTPAKNNFVLLPADKEQELIAALIKTVPSNDDAVLYNLAIADMLGRHGFFDEALEHVKKSKRAFDSY
jgi:hypothetical protein